MLLDVLEKYQIKALFCLLGVNAEQYPELVEQIIDKGHYIIDHGYFDQHAIKMKDDAFKSNILLGEKAIWSNPEYIMGEKLYRPHGGFYNARHVRICADEGYIIVPVTIRVYDAVVTSAKQKKIANNVIRKTVKGKGGVILLHDSRGSYLAKEASFEKNQDSSFNRSWIPQIVDEIIITLRDEGYVFPDPQIFINLLSNKNH